MSSSSPSLHSPAASSVDAAPSTRLLTLQDFGVSAGTTMEQLLQEHGSFELLAWYGDQLLERFVSERIWERAMKAVDDAAAAEADASPASSSSAVRSVSMTAASLSYSVSPQMLHDERVRFTANRALAQYLKHATEIHPPRGDNEHAYGTAFEFLLCLAQRTRGADFVRQRVHEYMDWVTENDALVVSVPMESIPLQLKWSSSDDSTWVLSAELDCYEGRCGILTSEQEPDETPDFFFSRLISRVQLSRIRQMWAERLLALKRKLSATHFEAQLARMVVQVEQDPFCNVAVPAAEIPVMSGGIEVISVVPQSKHTGAVVRVPWRSRTKMWYREPFWSCCGMRGATQHCNRPNWERPACVHRGQMEIPTGTNTHRMGGGIGSVPIGQFPRWTCCGQMSIAQGCRSPPKPASKSKAADVVTVTPTFTDGEDLRLSCNESAGSRAVRRSNAKGGDDGGSIVWHEAASSSIPRVMRARSVNDWNPDASALSVGTWTLSYPAVGINESGPAHKNSDAHRAATAERERIGAQTRKQLFEQQKANDAVAAKGQRGCFAKLLSFVLWTVLICAAVVGAAFLAFHYSLPTDSSGSGSRSGSNREICLRGEAPPVSSRLT